MNAEQQRESRFATIANGRTTVLVVDDEPAFQETIARYLDHYRRLTAYNGQQARQALSKHHVDVVLLDLNLPDTTGRKLIEEIRADRDDVEIIIVTSHAELKIAVDCVRAGAFDFLAKSYENYQRIEDHIERALEHRRRRRAELARADETLRDGLAQLEASRSPQMQEVVKLLKQVAATPLTVLVEGESGVGKELCARYVHLLSNRAANPFVAVNVAALPQTLVESTLFGHEKGAFTSADRQRLGKFELADGGTLFLDEIAELDLPSQAKLLRALQEREIERVGGVEPIPVDVRIVAATNKQLDQEVIAGRFREDLYYRLNVVRVKVPPLRNRKDDLPDLVNLLGQRHARAMGRQAPAWTKDAMRILMSYTWPGNVRELENLVMRMVALHPGATIRAADIPIEYCMEHLGNLALWYAKHHQSSGVGLYQLATEHFERYLVRHMVERCGGSKAEAARVLGISYATVKNKMATPASDDDSG